MAFNISVPDYVVDASEQLVGSVKLGNRGDGSDGTIDQQVTGVIGQNMVQLAINGKLMTPGNGFDGGIDVEIYGMSFDVKTMGRTTTPKLDYVNNLVASQTKYSVDAYLFCSLNSALQVLTVCGWLPKSIVFDRAQRYEKGQERLRDDGSSFTVRADMYEIKNESLFYGFNNWPELFREIHLYQQVSGRN